MQTRFIRVTNVHPWSFAYGLEALQPLDVGRFVGGLAGVLASAFGGFGFAHG